MQWAEAGSLDNFLSARLGYPGSIGSPSQTKADNLETRSARIRAFRATQAVPPGRNGQPTRKKEGAWRAVHLLSTEEVLSLLKDIVEGLAYLVSDENHFWYIVTDSPVDDVSTTSRYFI